MRYIDVDWDLQINGEHAPFDTPDEILSIIADEILNGNTSGFFTTDSTDYAKFDELKEKLEQELGRDVDCDVDDTGELDDLLVIAQDNNDNYVQDLIEQLLYEIQGE